MSSFGSVANKKELNMNPALLAVFRKYSADQERASNGEFGSGGNGDSNRQEGAPPSKEKTSTADLAAWHAANSGPGSHAGSGLTGTHSGASPHEQLTAGNKPGGAVVNDEARARMYGLIKETDDLAALNVVKAEEEHRYTLGLAYPAMKPDSARAADGYIDFVSSEVLEKTAWSWMEKNHEIGMFHRDGTEGHATVVESYIYRGPDWQVGPTVIKAGDWLMGCQWDDYGWQMVKSGLANGWSPEGSARRSKPSPSRLAELRS